MKIIHSAPGKGGKEAGSEKSRAREGKPAAPPRPAVPLGNPDSLRAMLKDIREFRAGDMPLQSLVSELEYHLQALIMDDHRWQSTFFERWRELDRQQASQLARGEEEINAEAMQRIDSAIEELRQLITSVLSGMETR